jgi:hypothetical protein
MGETINIYTLLVGKPEAKRPLWRPRSRLEDNSKIDLHRNRVWGCEINSSSSGHGPIAGFIEYGN